MRYEGLGDRAVTASAQPAEDQWATEVADRLIAWGSEHFQSFPWRRPIPAWQALVAEVLLVRTRATQVVPVFERLLASYRTPAALATITPRELEQLVATLGLEWRAKLLHRLLLQIAARGGEIPLNERELRQLPGVGAYTAAATLSLHCGVRATIVDANVVRVLCRLAGEEFDGETRRKRWLRDLAERLTPDGRFRDYGYALLDLAMTVCVRQTPLCGECPLRRWCRYGASAPPAPRSPQARGC